MILKKLTHEGYDELLSLVDIDFFENQTFFDRIESLSENIIIDGNIVEINLDIDEYNEIIKKSESKGESSKLLAKKLHKDFVFQSEKLPRSIMYTKEIWTYLNLIFFKEIIKEKYFDDGKISVDKIRRYYFNDGGISKIDRTGLRYLWVLADLTYDEDMEYQLFDVAWDFIDPFKALQECLLGRNPLILKAFAKAILDLNCNATIKNSINRKVVPKHIRNYACANLLDSYDSFTTLAEKMKEQIEIIINL
ncbi:MAG: DUF6339 family protein [Bacilli bacterium]